MTTPYVQFDHVSKKFRRGERHDSLRDLFAGGLRALASADSVGEDEFWSVRDLSFRVEPGDTLGIIGSNGAGKSTTLKLLTRILRPNVGSIRTEGRIGALIEVAAGFHADLTGRENVFLQGAIMGMPQSQIARRFDEIVAFSGIAEFIDTPVKRYSSGMNARLGFAIAAHLDPDILVIDEVLAVGDLSFQRRAFERLRDLARQGLPVIVVSHQLDKVRELCSGAILLDRGRVAAAGNVDDVLAAYLHPPTSAATRLHVSELRLHPAQSEYVPGTVVIVRLQLRPADDWHMAEELVGVRLMDAVGNLVGGTGSDRVPMRLTPGAESVVDLSFGLHVAEGLYRLEVFVWQAREHREVEIAGATSVAVASGTGESFGPVHLGFSALVDAGRLV